MSARLKLSAAALCLAAAVVLNVLVIGGLLDMLNLSSDAAVAGGFIGCVALAGIDVLAAAAIWNRIRRYIAPMIVLIVTVGLVPR